MSSMEEAFHKHPYSWCFNTLIAFGQWTIHTENKSKKIAYNVYRTSMVMYGISIAILGFIDLYQCKDNFVKAAFNLCTTTLSCGITIKNIHLIIQSEKLDKLRFRLFSDSWTQNEPEEKEIKEYFLKIWLYQRRVFYVAAATIMPIWWVTSLKSLISGPRELPFPVYLPLNLDDNFQYFWGFVYHMVGSFYISSEVMQADLGMFSIMLQIAAQYGILAKNVMDIDNLYSEDPKNIKEKESNAALAHLKTKEKLKECVKKQLTLMGYLKELEYCYNPPMLLQLFCACLLSIGNGLEIIVVSMSFSAKLSYQVLYSLIVLADIFMICTLAELLKTQYKKLEFSLYDIAWYKMDSSCRRDLYLMTIGAQNYCHLTAGKMFDLDRTTFRGVIKNVYSWLALCRQVLMKK